ncbi:MAG: DUF523 domain-containing protein [Gammaproteobacteria bacterium]|jgi:uncharacterized protein YbbK (DUF523 family)
MMLNHSKNTFESGLGQVRLGVSACLLGAKVRFDGDHKRNCFLIDELGRYFEFVPFCPEVAIGMGTPRPSIHWSVMSARHVRLAAGTPVLM